MPLHQWLKPPRAVLILFFLLMTACATALGWLGWQLLEQDRSVERQRRRERLENASAGVAGALQLALASGAARVQVTATSVTITPAGALAFIPADPAARPVPPEVFAAAEAIEFNGTSSGDAGILYRGIAASDNPAIRAEALVRAARVYRRTRRPAEALQAYKRLEELGNVPVAGMPAAMVARGGRCALLAEAGSRGELAREAEAMWNDLTSGRWPVNRATLDTYVTEIRQWLPDARFPGDWQESVIMAEAARRSWQTRSGTSGRALASIDGEPVSVVWETHDSAWQATVAGPRFLRERWRAIEDRFRVQLRLISQDGDLLHGPEQPVPDAVLLSSSETGVPIQIAVARASGAAELESARRPLLIGGLAVFAVLLAGGAFFIGRAINKEIAVAQMQTDFVAAVSHEFRTPLTSIRQLTELLARGRLHEPGKVQKAYELMMSESDRLKRLVESILDFGRMRSGTYQFRFESTPATTWTQDVVNEFRSAVAGPEVSLTFQGDESAAGISADREALRGALWNLLDNAVKYSPQEKDIRVETGVEKGLFAIRVRDRGMGIPQRDLRKIFDRFYRSETAQSAGAKGTGIGLALVKEIVEAHGGAIRAESEVGSGSTFTIVLPCEKSA